MSAPPSESDKIQVEIVDEDGVTSVQQAVNIEDILRQKDHSLEIAPNVRLQVEEFNPEEYYEDDDLEESEDTSESTDSSFGEDSTTMDPPPGTQAGNWYEVLNALRQEQEETIRAEEQRRRKSKKEGPEGVLIGRGNSKTRSSVATPLKKFKSSNSIADGDKLEPKNKALVSEVDPKNAPQAHQGDKSRQEVWSSFAPPAPTPERDYNHLQYVSTNAPGARYFKPPPLTFHSATSYVSAADMCRRILVFGGVSAPGTAVEQELYEFSLLTLNWRRIEGKQLVPAGHYGHAMVVVEPLDKLVVVGGIGPGGIYCIDNNITSDPLKMSRMNQLLPVGFHNRKLSSKPITSATPVTRNQITNENIGFVPYVFDMSLSTQCWRAVQTALVFPLAFHTAIAFGKEVFVYGGLNEKLDVQGNLYVLNIETYTVRVVNTFRNKHDEVDKKSVPEPRFLHTAVRYGNYMVIFGGANERNEVLNDVWAFDMVNERWEQFPCRGEVMARGGHAAAVVGCRMIVFGGFEFSLEEFNVSKPASAVMELNLVPTKDGVHLWKEKIRCKPSLPPAAFSSATTCGDEASFFVYGGLTQWDKKKAAKEKRAASQSRTRSHSAASPSRSRSAEKGKDEEKEDDDTNASLLKHFLVLDDSLVISFKPKAVKKAEDDEVHVNELGVEVDPDELPEHFKTFVRRQEDFVKKKHVAEAAAIKKITLEEQEGMEPTLYLADDEINAFIQKSENCCEAFLNEYKVDTLPSNVPDRETRVHIIEECISLSRQARDVMKSMKGSEAGVTAVKSKSHRMRAGKFEDYSAAKPFRRAVINNLIASINHQLAHMHQLNKGLRTVDWEEKEEFIAAIGRMQDSVNDLVKTINHVINKYIKKRVSSLIKGVEKHEEVMRLLREVVERNRNDKIWGRDDQPDKQRARVKKEWKKGEAAEEQANKTSKAKKASSRNASAHSAPRSRHRSRSVGAGFYKDEESVSVPVISKEWKDIIQQSKRIEKTAQALERCCQAEMADVTGQVSSPMPAAYNPPPQGLPPQPQLSSSPLPPPPFPGQSPTNFSLLHTQAPSFPGLPGQQGSPNLPSVPPQVNFAQPIQPSPFGQPMINQAPVQVPGAAGEQNQEIGAANPKETMIRHSNELRAKVIEISQMVQKNIQSFCSALENEQPMNAAPSSGTIPPAPAPSHQPVEKREYNYDLNAPHPLVSAVVDPSSKTPEERKKAEERQTYNLKLNVLRPLSEMKEKMGKISSKVALIRKNNWDGNDLGGAPQDMQVIKLHKTLLNQLTALFQRTSANFLTRAGVRKKGVRHSSPIKGQKSSRQKSSTRSKSAPNDKEERPCDFGAKRAESSSSDSSSSSNRRKRARKPNKVRGGSDASDSQSFSRKVKSIPDEPNQSSYSSPKGPAVLKIPGKTVPKQPMMEEKPSAKKTLAPVKYDITSHVVPLSVLQPRQKSSAADGDERASSTRATDENPLYAVPLINPQIFSTPTPPPPSANWNKDATGGTTEGSKTDAQDEEAAIETAGGLEANRVPNDTSNSIPYWSPSMVPSVVNVNNRNSMLANSWSVVNNRKAIIYDQMLGEPTARPPVTIQSRYHEDGECGATQVNGAVLHIPDLNAKGAGVSAQNAAESGEGNKPRRSTILALTQMGGGKEADDYLTTTTSIGPGAFVVNADHFYETMPATNPSSSSPDAASSAVKAKTNTTWADADDDYFYFGKVGPSPHEGSAVTLTPAVTMPDRSNNVAARQYPPHSVSPPIGSALASQNVNAQRKISTSRDRKTRSRSSGYGVANRQTVSSQGKKTQPVLMKDDKSHLTPGERKILEARERLKKKVK